MDRLKIAITVASLFSAIDTIFLILQLCFKDSFEITIFGYYYVCFSIIINIAALRSLLVILMLKDNKIKTLKSMGVLLLAVIKPINKI